MSLIKTASDMPLKNWCKLISQDVDLNYMFTDFEVKHEITKEVESAYINILSEMPQENKTSFEYFTLFIASLLQMRIKKELNEMQGLFFDDIEFLDKSVCGQFFSEYLQKINSENQTYIFDEYYFENLPESFSRIKDVRFYHFSEFLYSIENLPEKETYLNNLFLERHLKSREIEISAIELDAHMIKFFLAKDKYYEFFEVRAQIFNINTLRTSKKKNENFTFEYELAIIQKVTGCRLTLNENMLSEYIAAKKLMNEINKENLNHGKI